MHPYITQLLINERLAELHRNAAARRTARQARLLARLAERAGSKRPAPPIVEGPRQARLGRASQSARPTRHSLHGRGTGLALATRPDEDIVLDDQALCGICDDL